MSKILMSMFTMFIDDDVEESIRVLLDAAVHKRTMAERRIGCLLSGPCHAFSCYQLTKFPKTHKVMYFI